VEDVDRGNLIYPLSTTDFYNAAHLVHIDRLEVALRHFVHSMAGKWRVLLLTRCQDDGSNAAAIHWRIT